MATENIYHKMFLSISKFLLLRNLFTVVNIFCVILIVRTLSPLEYGKWSLVWQMISNFAPLISLGFLSTLSKFIPEYMDTDAKDKLFSKAFFMVGLCFLVAFVLYGIAMEFFSGYIPIEIRNVKFVFALFIGVSAFINLFEGYYRGYGKFNIWTSLDGLRSVCSALFAVTLLLTLTEKYEIVFYCYFFTASVFLTSLLISHRKNIQYSGIQIEKQILRFTFITLFGQILFWLFASLDPVLIRYLLRDPSQVAFYDVGIRIPMMLITFLLSPLSVPFLYFFSHSELELDKKKVILFGTRMISVVVGLVSVLIFSFSSLIIPLLFKNTYNESIPILELYIFVPFLNAFQSFVSPFFLAINKPLIPLLIGIPAFLTYFLLDYLLIPHFKGFGAALSGLIINFIVTIFYVYILGRHNIHLSKLFSLFFLVIISSVSLAKLFGLPYIAIPVYIILAVAIRLIAIDDIRKVTSFIKMKK